MFLISIMDLEPLHHFELHILHNDRMCSIHRLLCSMTSSRPSRINFQRSGARRMSQTSSCRTKTSVEVWKASAESIDANVLTDLAVRSKAYWGYDNTFLQQCREELTVSQESIASGDVYVATISPFEHSVVGFFVLCNESSLPRQDKKALFELDALFVDPKWIGHGVGRVLMEQAVRVVQGRGGTQIQIQSDPHAERFYLKMGCHKIGEMESSSIQGRVLPLLTYNI